VEALDRRSGTEGADDDLVQIAPQVRNEVTAFLANFDIYLTHIGDLEAQLRLIPSGMWAIIDSTAYGLTSSFMEEHDLDKHSRLPSYEGVSGHHLEEALVFLLKVAWEKGYLMYKFRKLDYIPSPAHGVDPLAVYDQMLKLARPNMADNIEVFLQRCISVVTEDSPIRRTLGTLGKDVLRIMNPLSERWANVVRGAFASGVLIGKAEMELNP